LWQQVIPAAVPDSFHSENIVNLIRIKHLETVCPFPVELIKGISGTAGEKRIKISFIDDPILKIVSAFCTGFSSEYACRTRTPDIWTISEHKRIMIKMPHLLQCKKLPSRAAHLKTISVCVNPAIMAHRSVSICAIPSVSHA
jgi:hypothetical protein